MVSDHFSFHHFAGWIPETRVLEGRTGGTSGVILMAVIDDIRCTCIDGCLALFQFNIKLVRLFRRTSNSSAVASFQISIQWNDAYFLSRYVQCQVLRYTSRNDSVCAREWFGCRGILHIRNRVHEPRILVGDSFAWCANFVVGTVS